jgi:hypothetical protein
LIDEVEFQNVSVLLIISNSVVRMVADVATHWLATSCSSQPKFYPFSILCAHFSVSACVTYTVLETGAVMESAGQLDIIQLNQSTASIHKSKQSVSSVQCVCLQQQQLVKTYLFIKWNTVYSQQCVLF